jgi:prefoldin subunit 5
VSCAAGNVTELTEQLSNLEASSNELSSKLQDLQQEHSQVRQDAACHHCTRSSW